MRKTATRSLFVLLITAIAGVLFLTAPASATTTISQGYITESDIPVGSVVSLIKNSTDTVEMASIQTSNNLLGAVINDGSSMLSLNTGAKSQVQVATSGVVPVLVSDCSGAIHAGDLITASPIKGVGMLATTNTKVVGVAQGEMSGTTKQKVEGDVCANHEVSLGQVPVLISVSYHYKQPEKTIIPAALQNIANTIAGKQVSSLPIIVSSAIFIITVIVVSMIIYAMIRSSIISVGRNPLSQSAVYRDVIQLSALVLALLGMAVIAIYFILTRL